MVMEVNGYKIAARLLQAMDTEKSVQQNARAMRAVHDESARIGHDEPNDDPIQHKDLRTGHDEKMVRPLGIEPRTCGLRVRCSTS